jgi:hypothetical protein
VHKLAEIRSQELVCRERALSNPDHRELWLAKAEEWGQRALDEIVFQFRESDGLSLTGAAAQTTSNQNLHV